MILEKKRIVESLVNLEYGVAGLYHLYADLFEADRAFWQQLAEEEEAHAKFLKKNKVTITERLSLSASGLEGLASSFKMITKRIFELSQEYKKEKPTQKEAYVAAIQLEQSAGEIHFKQMASCMKDSNVRHIFEKFNQADQDHSKRIRNRLADAANESAE